MRALLLVVTLAGCSAAVAQSPSPADSVPAPHKKVVFVTEDPPQEGTIPVVHPVSVEQLRIYFLLTKADDVYRTGWLAALEMNRSKGAPY